MTSTRAAGAAASVSISANTLADFDFGSFGDLDAQYPGFERGDLGGDFVGIEDKEKIADGDLVSVLFMPG